MSNATLELSIKFYSHQDNYTCPYKSHIFKIKDQIQKVKKKSKNWKVKVKVKNSSTKKLGIVFHIYIYIYIFNKE